MFGGSKYSTVKAGSVFKKLTNGVSPSSHGQIHEKVLTLSAITQGDFDSTSWKEGTFADCPPEEKRITSGRFYICRGNGNKALVGTGVYSKADHPELVFPDTVIAVEIDDTAILLPFLSSIWQQSIVREQIEREAKTTNGTYKINQQIIGNLDIVLPPIEAQKTFVCFLEQSDKSKYIGHSSYLKSCKLCLELLQL